jgi:hypothetical protein
MRRYTIGTHWLGLAATGLLMAACAGTQTETAEPAAKSHYQHFVVIGIAGDYEARAHFERRLVSHLRSAGASASTFHSLIGGNKPVTREDVLAMVAEHGFDSVLAVRRLDSDVELKVTKSRTEVDATPIGGRIVNLFRSDYTDYTTPGSVDLATKATLAIELYDAQTEAIVYSFDHQTRQETDLGLLIDETAAAIVKRIEREKLIAN